MASAAGNGCPSGDIFYYFQGSHMAATRKLPRRGPAAKRRAVGMKTMRWSGGRRQCDFCESSEALVYCRADSARLCLACDRLVHAANTVSSRHSRSLLCDACVSAPASLLRCGAASPGGQRRRDGHPLLLCANCDFDAGEVGRAAERRPVEPYSGCPAAEEMISLLGVPVEEEKVRFVAGDGDDGGGDGGGDEGLLGDDAWMWETPPILCMEDLLLPITPFHGFPAMGVPPPPKDRNPACGRHKEEILRQLRGLDLPEGCFGGGFEPLESDVAFHPPEGLEQGAMPSNVEDDASLIVPLYGSQAEAAGEDCKESRWDAPSTEQQPETSMVEGKVLFDGTVASAGDGGGRGIAAELAAAAAAPPPSSPAVAWSKYDKHIRYESRKARADGRLRIKGRFAKLGRTPAT
ncbi:unnamed protein product [Spirodela intermedia]|uniref:Uncharacterized protein n=1 Tax=Spirodela intermedia TaxID=51605 RepID=A0A7I8IZT6_SPIIN|nr:unnamed protein product [Spirodela intermedia]CAA6663474.1 unnamed protein product [Spirodela intermedia]